MRKLLVVFAVAAAGAVFALPAAAGLGNDPSGAQSGVGGSAPGTAQVGIQATTIGTDVSPINGFWNQGWWSDNSGNFNGNTNHIAGAEFGTTFRNYFTFDITALSAHPCATPQSATLRASAGIGSDAFYGVGPLFVTYTLYNVATDPFVLSQKDNNPDAAIFGDLGSGPIYGSYTLPTFTTGGTFNLALNATARNAIAAAKANGVEFFSLGGSLVPQPATTAFVMGFTHLAAFSFPATLTVNWPFVCRVRPPA